MEQLGPGGVLPHHPQKRQDPAVVYCAQALDQVHRHVAVLVDVNGSGCRQDMLHSLDGWTGTEINAIDCRSNQLQNGGYRDSESSVILNWSLYIE